MCWPILIGLLPALSLFGAGDTPLDRSTLRGLKGVSVVVDRLDPKLIDAGIKADVLQALLTRRMDGSDIGVNPDASEFLGLRLIHVRGQRGPYALCLTLGVYQPVTLARDPKIKTAVQTWEVQTVLISDPKGLADAISLAADELMDGFLAAYRSVNLAGAVPETAPVK